MSEILSQAEIEALLASLSAEEPEGSTSAPLMTPSASGALTTSRKAIAYEVYDFRRPDKFSRDQLRTLQMVFETFARLSATNLATYLRVPVHWWFHLTEQIPYEDYLRSLKQSAFIVFSAPPLSGESGAGDGVFAGVHAHRIGCWGRRAPLWSATPSPILSARW